MSLAMGIAACGSASSTPDEQPLGVGGAAGQSGGAGAAGEVATAWPTVDPDPTAAPTGEPTFEPPTPPVAATCTGKKLGAGDRVMTVPSGGLVRTVLVHVPASYDPAKGTMLVLNFHGYSSDGAQEQVLSRMNQASDANGFIAVHPYGVANSWNAGVCCGTAWLDGTDDVGFVGKMLDQLESDYCIDPKQVHSTGMSNGAFLSHRLACEMSDRIASIAPVAGVVGVPACNPSRPVPVLHFHGTSDLLVPYKGGQSGGIPGVPAFISVAESIAGWRERDKCPPGDGKPFYQQGDATCVRWSGCEQGSEVVLCTLEGGGHTWPGGVPVPALGKTSNDINATGAMVQFFKAHPMP